MGDRPRALVSARRRYIVSQLQRTSVFCAPSDMRGIVCSLEWLAPGGKLAALGRRAGRSQRAKYAPAPIERSPLEFKTKLAFSALYISVYSY